jgi:hypothetical protein
MRQSIALRPAPNCRAVCAEAETAECFRCGEAVRGRILGAEESFPKRFNFCGDSCLSISAGVSGNPRRLALLSAGLQIGGVQLPESAFGNAKLIGPGACRNLSVTILRHQVADETGTVAPAQLLVRFFS